VFLKLFGMNEATLMRGPPDGGERSARTDNALHGAGADVGNPERHASECAPVRSRRNCSS
jgi:hypothetical protein